MQIGSRMLGRAEADADDGPDGEPAAGEPLGGKQSGGEPVSERAAARYPGADGTLLAVVPIPGTGTSLAIVGYPVTAHGSVVVPGTVPVGAVPDLLVRDGPVFDGPVFAGAGVPGQAADGSPGLLLDQDQRRVWADGSEVTLTFQEFELLAFLAAHPATVFSRADLVREVWQRDFAADSRTVDVHVSRLRRKLGPAHGRCLVTEYRVGYQFRPIA